MAPALWSHAVVRNPTTQVGEVLDPSNKKRHLGVAGATPRCFSWRRLEVHSVLLLLQKKNRQVSGHPVTVGRTQEATVANSAPPVWLLPPRAGVGGEVPLMSCPTPATPRSEFFIPLYTTKQKP